jgi:hypothetical protein
MRKVSGRQPQAGAKHRANSESGSHRPDWKEGYAQKQSLIILEQGFTALGIIPPFF